MSIVNNGKVILQTKPSTVAAIGDAWVVQLPRFGEDGTHFHTYGLLTPYFKGLAEGTLLATKCVNARCPVSQGSGELWLPPRADCPDCHQPMTWQQVADPRGYIYSYTHVARGGTGLEIECPYYQIDVKINGVCTILKSYLLDRRPIRIGDRVRARFRTGPEATHTCLDLCWELE
ncbi:MAG TPA: OB-fold domain-containing protein [Vicinamibacterales bacterium]|nr:OB-fold domain-containing protein [Vicinamibacterales bacterium]